MEYEDFLMEDEFFDTDEFVNAYENVFLEKGKYVAS